MKVLVVSGFLGSGKTCFINELIGNKPINCLIMENEFASVNIDADLLNSSKDKIWEMTEGCICCSMNADMGRSVLTVANTYEPEFLIIEPTGIGKLSQILHSISRVLYDNIQLLPPITIVDALCFWDYIRQEDPYYKDQIVYAKKIYISKTETLTKLEIIGITAMIKKLNPSAQYYIDKEIDATNTIWNEVLELNSDTHALELTQLDSKHPDLEQIAFTDISETSLNRLSYKIQLLLRGTFGEILRLKGFLPVQDQWTKVDIVTKRFKFETIDEKEQSKLVIIGRKLQTEYLEDLFVHDGKQLGLE